MMALATRYEVSAHVASSMEADRLPAMCGSDTLTTVVSSTSMKVANMTETAISHGLTYRSGGITFQIAELQNCRIAGRHWFLPSYLPTFLPSYLPTFLPSYLLTFVLPSILQSCNPAIY
jgi:hypothetical protein